MQEKKALSRKKSFSLTPVESTSTLNGGIGTTKKDKKMEQTTKEPKDYTVEEIAEKLRVTPRTVLNIIRRQELVAYRVGAHWRITQESFDKFRGVQ
jgi:excisionase family DNA binding protein